MPINPLSASQQEADDKQKRFNTLGGGEPVNISGQASGQPAQASGTPTSSGSFTNLQSYLDANKDQAAGLGAKIQENVEGTANEGRTALSQSGKEFDSRIEEAGIDRNQLSSNALSNIIQKGYNGGEITDDDAATFADIRNKNTAFSSDADAGPKTLSDLNTYQGAKAKFSEATDKAKLTESEGGRETLLRDAFKRPSYSKGESSLDQLLTQNAPENKDRLQSLRTGLLGDSGLVSEDNKAIQAASERRALEKKEVSDAYGDEQDLLYNPNNKEELVNVRKYVDPRLSGGTDTSNGLALTPETDENGRQYYNAQVNKYGALTQEEQAAQALAAQLQTAQQLNYEKALAAAHIQDQTHQTLGADLSPAVKKASDFQANLANSLTPEQYARIQALNKLAGRDPGQIGSENLGGLASQQFDPTVNFDKDTANKLVNDRIGAFKSDMGNVVNTESANVPGYRWGNLPLADAGQDIVTRMLDGDPQPDLDSDSANKVISAYESALSQANSVRSKYGLEPLNVDSFYEGGSLEAATKKAAEEYLNEFGKGQVGGYQYPAWYKRSTPEAFNAAVDVLLHNPEKGGYGIAPDVRDSMEQAAKIRALQALMATNREQLADPTKKIAAGLHQTETNSNPTANTTPTRVFFD